MKVSVIIPFYSNIVWLEEAVDSVLNQTFKDYEIIVVNDGSPEEDSVFLSKYKDEIKYYKTENKGPAHARNFGIKLANGEYIAFLDSDDLWLREKLDKQINFMLENDSDWSHTNYFTFNDKTQGILKYNTLEEFSGNVYPKILARAHVATPSVIIKRDVFLNEKFSFQEKMRFGQDYYLWLKLSQSYKLDLLPEFLLKVRVRGTNAAIRTRAHMQVRAQIWSLLKTDPIFNNLKFGWAFRFTYIICYYENILIQKLDSKLNKDVIERISKCFYVLPYLLFRILFRLTV